MILYSTVWSFMLCSHCAPSLLQVTLKSPSHILTDRPMHTHSHRQKVSLFSLSKTLEEQGSGKCCSMLKRIRKICKCSSWLLHVRIATVARGLQLQATFFLTLLFLGILLRLMWGREATFQNQNTPLYWHSSSAIKTFICSHWIIFSVGL